MAALEESAGIPLARLIGYQGPQMATQPPHRVLEPLAAPQHFAPPSARALRAQAVQRLQAGLFGLAAIVLMVGLANIINDRARMAEANGGSLSASASNAEAVQADPLADAGVVPSATPETDAAKPPRRNGTGN